MGDKKINESLYKKIYVVSNNFRIPFSIKGIFSTYKRAKEMRKVLAKRDGKSVFSYDIDSYDLDMLKGERDDC